MTAWTLARNEPAGIGLRWLRFNDTPPGYDVPGQYVLAGAPGAPAAFFAIASNPGAPLELLVKAVGPAAEAIAMTRPGEVVQVSEVQGSGFSLAGDERTRVVLVNGSGISAVRPVIEREVRRGLPCPVHVYYGVLTPEHRSFLADLEAWGNLGIQVHTVVGAPDGTGWSGATGFVQQLAQVHGLVRSDTVVIAAGVPPMIESARSLWGAVGAEVLTNF